MRFESDFIERVREANNIVDIISQYTQLKRSGSRWTGLCPFPDHNEKTPSFSVSEDKQLYYCFGCKKSGNIFNFVEQFNGMNFPEAVEFLARRASIALPEPTEKDAQYSQQKSEKQLLLKVNRLAGTYYLNYLVQNKASVSDYLEKRDLNEETQKTFKLGLASENWSDLVAYLKKKGAPLAAAEKLGLIRKRKSGDGYYDLFRERLMFPIFSPTGDCIGFGGRSMDGSNPKYINSPESPVFHKGRMVYGLNESSKYVRVEDQVIVVEGYMDYLALYQAGIRNVVATLGTALTADHGRLLKRYTKNIVLLFDGDNAGIEAAERSLEVLLSENLLPRVCFLADGMDPDDFLKANSAEDLKSEIRASKDLFDFKLARLLENFHGQTSERFQIFDKLKGTLGIPSDNTLREFLILQVSEALNVPPDWVLRQLKSSQNESKNNFSKPHAQRDLTKSVKSQQEIKNEEKASDNSLLDMGDSNRYELIIFSLALKASKLLEFVRDEEILNLMSSTGVRLALSEALEKYGQKPEEFDKLAAFFASRLKDPGVVEYYLSQVPGELTEEEEMKLLLDCVARLQKERLKAEAKKLRSKLGTKPDQEELERIVNIHRDRLSLDNKR